MPRPYGGRHAHMVRYAVSFLRVKSAIDSSLVIALAPMPANLHKPTGAAFAWRLALFYSALCAALGFQMPFLPVWLAAKGLDAVAVGIALAIPLVVRLLAIPAASWIADRYDAARAVIMIGAAGSLAGYIAVGLAGMPGAIMVAIALASAFYVPLMPLADAYALRGLTARGRGYGPVRLWGSAAFIAGTLVGGLLLDLIAPRELIWVVVTALLLNAAAAAALAPLGDHRSGAGAHGASASMLLRNSRFLIVAAAAALVQASHAVFYGFSALQWRADGLDGMTIGALWAIGVLAEILLFAVSPRLALEPTTLLLAGAAGAVVRWAVMALDPPPVLLLMLQCLHGLSFGATHLGAVGFVARAAPAGLGASAQGYLAVVGALVMAGVMGISGELYAQWGSGAYWAMAVLAALGAVVLLAGTGRERCAVDQKRTPPFERR
jgi:MFS transporter, PPP family, 3-phenylpropionic acid transporter